jgi:hypothetical protein
MMGKTVYLTLLSAVEGVEGVDLNQLVCGVEKVDACN